MMKWKIIADSGCDLREIENLAPDTQYINVPLTVQVGDKHYTDDASLDIDAMMIEMYQTKDQTASACPSPDAFLEAYKGAENVIAITITGGLSGSQNSAQLAKNMLLEEAPETNIEVFDSLSASSEMVLFVQKANELISQGLSYEEVVAALKDYLASTKLLFVLARVDNLVKNGRLNKLVGAVIGMLNIHLVGNASPEGTLNLLHKAKGQKKAVQALWAEMKKNGYKGGRVVISHCSNPEICGLIQSAIHGEFPEADVSSIHTSGICSYYAEQGGILMGYEA
jgi:DegV family protein